MIQNPLRTPLKLHAPAFLACAVFSLLPLLPSRASSLSLFAGLRLPSSPRAPCLVWFCLPASLPFVLVSVCGFPPFLLAWPVFWFGLFGASWCCLSLSVLSVLRFALVGFASRQLTEVTKDGRVLSTLQYTHTRHFDFLPLSSICWGLVCPLIRLFLFRLGCSVAWSLWHVLLIL